MAKQIIFTNHAIQKLKERAMSKDLVVLALNKFNTKSNGKKRETYEFTKSFDRSTVTVIAKQNEKSEWLILSCWIEPPIMGTKDFKDRQEWKKYKKSKGLMKFIYALKKQLGF